jgi:hypothetical protein
MDNRDGVKCPFGAANRRFDYTTLVQGGSKKVVVLFWHTSRGRHGKLKRWATISFKPIFVSWTSWCTPFPRRCFVVLALGSSRFHRFVHGPPYAHHPKSFTAEFEVELLPIQVFYFYEIYHSKSISYKEFGASLTDVIIPMEKKLLNSD